MIQLYIDVPTGIFYAIAKPPIYERNSDDEAIYTGATKCIYIRNLPRGLFNVFRRRAIVEAQAQWEFNEIRLMCNRRRYVLYEIEHDIALGHEPCFCVYNIKPLRYMGEEAGSMFIDNVIYSSDSTKGLWQVFNGPEKSAPSVVALTEKGPEIVKGVQTTMYNGDYQQYYWGAFPDIDSLRVYGVSMPNPYYYQHSDWVRTRYPLFEPITPVDAYVNMIGQLTVIGRRGAFYHFNNVLGFECVNFYKNEDWPIGVVYKSGEEKRFNLMMFEASPIGIKGPFLIGKDNKGINFMETTAGGFFHNRFGMMDVIAERDNTFYGYDSSIIPYDERNPYDGAISKEIRSAFCENITIYAEKIIKDRAGNHYAVYEKRSDYLREIGRDSCNTIEKVHPRSAPAMHTKPARRIEYDN